MRTKFYANQSRVYQNLYRSKKEDSIVPKKRKKFYKKEDNLIDIFDLSFTNRLNFH